MSLKRSWGHVLNLSENVNICSTCLVVFNHITSIRSAIYSRKDRFGLTWFFRVKLSLVVTFLHLWCSDHIFHRVLLNIWKVVSAYNEVVLEKPGIGSSIAMTTWLKSDNTRILLSHLKISTGLSTGFIGEPEVKFSSSSLYVGENQ